jgi:hypothetical protein
VERPIRDGSSVARKSCPAGRTYFAQFCFHSGFLRRGDLVGFFFAAATGLEECLLCVPQPRRQIFDFLHEDKVMSPGDLKQGLTVCPLKLGNGRLPNRPGTESLVQFGHGLCPNWIWLPIL